MKTKQALTPDQIVEELFKKLQAKKALLESIEKPHFKTNLSFGFSEELNSRVNIHTVNNVEVLIRMAAFLLATSEKYEQAATMLGVTSQFKWLGYSLEDWMHDIQARTNKINIEVERKTFKQLEEKLNLLVSPEQRRLMEIEAISKILE